MAIRDRLESVPVVATVVQLQDRYRADDADQYAAAIAFFGFLSLFPLIVVAISVVGFVVADRPDLQADLVRLIEDAIPAFEAVLRRGEEATSVGAVIEGLVDNRGGIGLLGLVTLLGTGLKLIGAGVSATAAVFHVEARMSGLKRFGHHLGALVGLGLLALGGVAASSAVGASVGVDVSSPATVAVSLAGTSLTLATDFALFMVAYRVLSGGRGPSWRRLWPGALLAATGWAGLKLFGATYVAGQQARFEFAGALAGVIGLLALLYLAGRLYLYGAELSALLYAPGADMAARASSVTYRGEDPDVLPGGPLRAHPGEEKDLAAPGQEEDPDGREAPDG